LADDAAPAQDEVVSSEDEALILVDADDREIGSMTKARCHEGDGALHRAFSLFVFNRAGELLVQQRSAGKKLWPLHWSNSCCSHPRHGETTDEAIHRRLAQELGIRSELHFLYKFQYQARYQDVGSENEICSVYLGVSDDEVRPNRHEISAWRWIGAERLDEEMRSNPASFTPWFTMEWQRVRPRYRDLLGIDPPSES
jgi:isopentenyl-diphosphate delta-isomerase